MIAVVKRRDTSKNEKERLAKQGEVVTAHNKGLLGRHWYKDGKDGKLYISPVALRKKI